MSIRKDTNTPRAGTKVDSYSDTTSSGGLSGGPQHVVGPLVQTRVGEHLPYSPAGGFPLQIVQFGEGHRWSEVDGKVHPGTGPHNSSW